MPSFIESPRFPVDISYGSSGGPAWMTTVVETDSGSETRNTRWSYPRHEYDVGYGLRTLDSLEELLKFFNIVSGKAIGFRYKDWMDFKSCDRSDTPSAADCQIGTGDGSEDEFQLYKTYTQGVYTRRRKILKPISGTVLIAVGGTTKTETTHYTINYTTGIVTFTGGNIPGNGVAVTAGFEFDVPCRFDTDKLSIGLDYLKVGGTQVPLIELKEGL